MENAKIIFPKGKKAAAIFTGTAFVNMLIADTDKEYNCQVYDVVFEAGARNNWHKHPGGQILLVTDGKGYYQERGKAARFLQKGTAVLLGRKYEETKYPFYYSAFVYLDGLRPGRDRKHNNRRNREHANWRNHENYYRQQGTHRNIGAKLFNGSAKRIA
jgi:hypothetical protein